MPNKLLLIIIDGCRPDGLAQAHTPHIDSLWQTGAYSWTAQSVLPSISLPAHTSMFRSIPPQVHGIHENVYKSAAATFPSIIEIAFQEARHTAMFYSWEELRDLAAPSQLYHTYYRMYRPGQDNDQQIVEAAIPYILSEQPDFAGIYLGDVDIIGHMHGWMSPEYLQTIEANDRSIGHLLHALTDANLRDAYHIFIISDHGGIDKSHGGATPEEMTIIWMLNGPGVKVNHQIETPVSLLDTAPTIAHILDLPRPAVWQGQPVISAFV